MTKPPDNREIAAALRDAASLLETQGANPHRVNAYRRAADTVESAPEELAAIFERTGMHGLDALPGIGAGLAGAIGELITTGHWTLLDRLRGTLDPVEAFQHIPGVGPEIARAIVDTLNVDTLEALEAAARQGKLAQVPGLGARRAQMIAAGVAAKLDSRRVRRREPAAHLGAVEPPVELLLDVDREYREKAAAGKLRRIAPKRYNPIGEAWLPILHAVRGPWHFTALFSNTLRAHELGHLRDWVVIYYSGDDHVEHQCTVVTESRGLDAGRRVVRGREHECRVLYAHAHPAGD